MTARPAPSTPDRFDELAGRTLLITGASGFLGRTVLRGLLASFPGRIISIRRSEPRHDEPRLTAPHQEIRADLREPAHWHPALAEADYVVWLAAVRDHRMSLAEAIALNVDPLRGALARLRHQSRPRRLILASSISALDQPTTARRPRRLSDDSVPCPRTPYGHSKLISERLLRASGLPYTVLRLPFLYGPGFRPGSFLDFYQTVAMAPALSAFRFTGTLSLLYTGDLAAVILALLATRDPASSNYLLSDPQTHQVDDLITMVARIHGRSRPTARFPVALSRAVSSAALTAARWDPDGHLAPGMARLLATYWAHAAFTRDYFVVDSSRFRAAFPRCAFTPVRTGLRESFHCTTSQSPTSYLS